MSTGYQRIRDLFARTRAEGRPAFLPFMTVGLPDPARSPGVFEAMAAAGADAFEIGLPYSDPLMDGPVIQRGSDLAIAAGTTLDRAFEVVSQIPATVPRLAMTYANPVFRRGVDWFCERLVAVGVDGIIVPDLPIEEAGSLRRAADRHGLGVVAFVAPTSGPERMAAVAETDPVFVYGVAAMGVTGERSGASGAVEGLAALVRSVSDVPLVFGVGISTPEQAVEAGRHGDGVIIGSALVRRVTDSPDRAAEEVATLVRSVAEALAGGASTRG